MDFQIQALQASEDWLSSLIQASRQPQEIQKTISLFWDWMESLESGLDRGDSKTWINHNWPGIKDLGFFAGYGGAHSKASWYLRCNKKIKQIFAKIYKTQDLIVSFDTFIAWRPWWHNSSWTPYVQNLHCDQNPARKKGFKCVQGMLPLYDVDKVGGLAVVPKTNNDQTQQQLVKRYPHLEWQKSDWVELAKHDPLSGKGKLVRCHAGDLILWDSRTIHGGLIIEPDYEFKKSWDPNKLVRLSMTIAMTPKSWASEKVLEKRRQAFEKRIGLTHWPHEFVVSQMKIKAKGIQNQKIQQLQISEQMRQLIG